MRRHQAPGMHLPGVSRLPKERGFTMSNWHNGQAQPPAGAPAEAGRLQRVLACFLFKMLSHCLSSDVQVYEV